MTADDEPETFCNCHCGAEGDRHQTYCIRHPSRAEDLIDRLLTERICTEQRRTRLAIEALAKGLAEQSGAAGSLRKFLGKLGGGG